MTELYNALYEFRELHALGARAYAYPGLFLVCLGLSRSVLETFRGEAHKKGDTLIVNINIL